MTARTAPEIPLAPCPDCGCGLIPTVGGGTWCPQCNTTRTAHGEVLVRGHQADQQPAAAPRDDNGLAMAGYVLGFLVPVVGVVIAFVLFTRDRVGPALATLMMSAISFAIYLMLFAAP